MDQKQRTEQLRALRDLLTTLETQPPPRYLPDFPVLRPSAGGWGNTAVPASTIYRPSPELLQQMGDLESDQEECEGTPDDEDSPWGCAGGDSMLQVRRVDLAEKLAREVHLTLLSGRLMAHVSRRRTEHLFAALQSGVRAILDAVPPAGPSGEKARRLIAALESGDEVIFSAGFRLPLEIGGGLLKELEAMQIRWGVLQARRAAYDGAETLRELAAIERYHGELDEAEYAFDLDATCLRSRLLEQMRALLE